MEHGSALLEGFLTSDWLSLLRYLRLKKNAVIYNYIKTCWKIQKYVSFFSAQCTRPLSMPKELTNSNVNFLSKTIYRILWKSTAILHVSLFRDQIMFMNNSFLISIFIVNHQRTMLSSSSSEFCTIFLTVFFNIDADMAFNFWKSLRRNISAQRQLCFFSRSAVEIPSLSMIKGKWVESNNL